MEGTRVAAAPCDVTVVRGSDLVAVFQAAQRSHCLASFTTAAGAYFNGDCMCTRQHVWLECIDRMCPGTYEYLFNWSWLTHINAQSGWQVYFDEYQANENDRVTSVLVYARGCRPTSSSSCTPNPP